MCREAESCEARAHLDLLLHGRTRALTAFHSTIQPPNGLPPVMCTKVSSFFVFALFFLSFAWILSLCLFSSFIFCRCFYVFSFSQPHRSHECIGIYARRHKRVLHRLYQRERRLVFCKNIVLLRCYIKKKTKKRARDREKERERERMENGLEETIHFGESPRRIRRSQKRILNFERLANIQISFFADFCVFYFMRICLGISSPCKRQSIGKASILNKTPRICPS